MSHQAASHRRFVQARRFAGRALLSCALAGVLLATTTACRNESTGRLVRLPVPAGWAEDLSGFRAARDAQFRTASSPLLPEDLAAFQGLDYWEGDSDLYFAGDINFYPDPVEMEIPATSGAIREAAKIGWVAFEIDGQQLQLQVYRLLDQDPSLGDGFFLPFTDGTSGTETYPAGRYLELYGSRGGPYVLDFNRAYNPSCAYGAPERFACPVTPRENRLPVRIEAGERGFKES